MPIDPQAVETLVTRAHREVDAGLVPSCQLAVAHEGELLVSETIGDAPANARYVIFSCTKALVAAVVWQLVREGSVDLAAPAASYVPAFGTNGKDVVTVEQLLTHTGGFPAAPMDPLEGADPNRREARFASWRLTFEPGTRFEYHPTAGHWVLAAIVQAVTGDDIRRAVTDRVTAPLGLEHLVLGVPIEDQGDICDLVVTGTPPTPEEMEAAIGVRIDIATYLGTVTPDALTNLNDPEVRAAGLPGGGAVSTAADLARFYQGLLHDPLDLWGPDRLAWASDVRCDLPDPMTGAPAHRSLGLQVAGDPPDAQRRAFGHGLSPRTFGHDGAGGQVAWCDPVSGLSFVYLTNGLDQHVLREARRKIGLSSRAAAILS